VIDEAIGKIIGMAMAYFVSSLGLFLAYVNYRRRIVKADQVMSPAAWMVVAVIVLGVVGGILIVGALAEPPSAAEAVTAVEPQPEPAAVERPAADPREGSRWPLLGMLLPAAIFLFATWITAGLYRHFSHAGH
jgi:hypothetical protein